MQQIDNKQSELINPEAQHQMNAEVPSSDGQKNNFLLKPFLVFRMLQTINRVDHHGAANNNLHQQDVAAQK